LAAAIEADGAMVFFTGRAPTFGEVAIATQELIRMVLLKARVN
jgi:hypothetical protein